MSSQMTHGQEYLFVYVVWNDSQATELFCFCCFEYLADDSCLIDLLSRMKLKQEVFFSAFVV